MAPDRARRWAADSARSDCCTNLPVPQLSIPPPARRFRSTEDSPGEPPGDTAEPPEGLAPPREILARRAARPAPARDAGDGGFAPARGRLWGLDRPGRRPEPATERFARP